MSENIYHLAFSSDWALAQDHGAYQAESLNAEGFIHCSKWAQVKPVFERFYRTSLGLWLLRIDVSELNSELVYENTEGGTELFPHVYGAIDLKAIVASHLMVSEDGTIDWPLQGFH